MIRRSPEFTQQCALFTWARMAEKRYPGLDLLSCSLNGVKLSKAQAGKAKAAGMLKGEYDVKLQVARGGYHGLSIEMKAGKNKLTDAQEWFGGRLAEEGWSVHCLWSWEAAKDVIIDYLAGRIIRP